MFVPCCTACVDNSCLSNYYSAHVFWPTLENTTFLLGSALFHSASLHKWWKNVQSAFEDNLCFTYLCSTLQVCHSTIRPPVDVLRTLDPVVPCPASHPPPSPSLDDVSIRNTSTCSSTSEEPSPHQLTPSHPQTSAPVEGPVQLC